jgi:hypothetical protein
VKDFVIVVQGASSYVKMLKESLKEFNVIYSTWEGQQQNYTESDTVIYNKMPVFAGPANLNLQKVTTIAGLQKAKELGYKRALKIRSDILPTNTKEFIKSLDNDSMNFLCWHYHEVYPNCPGYLIDYLMSGKIDDLLELWDINDMSWCSVPEIHLTQQYITKLINKVNVEYFLPSLNVNNDLYWIKRNINLSSYQENKIYDKYKKYDFGLNKEHLTKNYINFLS